MSAFLLGIKNVFHGFVAAAMLIPVLLTMGNEGDPNTPVEVYPDSDNPYIALQYWTVNDEKEVKTLTLNGANCIMTDYPQMPFETVKSCK